MGPSPVPPAPPSPPAPPPTPTPPAPPSPPPQPGDCEAQDTESDCNATTKGGEVCKWCLLTTGHWNLRESNRVLQWRQGHHCLRTARAWSERALLTCTSTGVFPKEALRRFFFGRF